MDEETKQIVLICKEYGSIGTDGKLVYEDCEEYGYGIYKSIEAFEKMEGICLSFEQKYKDPVGIDMYQHVSYTYADFIESAMQNKSTAREFFVRLGDDIVLTIMLNDLQKKRITHNKQYMRKPIAISADEHMVLVCKEYGSVKAGGVLVYEETEFGYGLYKSMEAFENKDGTCFAIQTYTKTKMGLVMNKTIKYDYYQFMIASQHNIVNAIELFEKVGETKIDLPENLSDFRLDVNKSVVV